MKYFPGIPNFCLDVQEIIKGHSRRNCRNCKKWYARINRKKDVKKYQREKRWAQRIAISQVYIAIRKGDLRKPNKFQCADCSNKAEVYDHRDYLKPLEVDPVCRICNYTRGEGKNKKVTIEEILR